MSGLLLVDWYNKNKNLGQDIYAGFMNCIDENTEIGLNFFTLTSKTNKKAYFSCDNPNHPIYFKRVSDVTRNGFYCTECSNLNKSMVYKEKKIKPASRATTVKETLLDWCNKNGDFGQEVYDGFIRCQQENTDLGIFIDKIGKGSKSKALFMCVNGHTFEKRIDAITGQKQWCKTCGSKNNSKKDL